MSAGTYLFGVIVFLVLSAVCFVEWVRYPSATTAVEVAAPVFLRCAPPSVRIGMSKAELLEKCGPAASISHQLIGANHDKEQWSYHSPNAYVYLLNGTVEAMQYAENGESFSWKER